MHSLNDSFCTLDILVDTLKHRVERFALVVIVAVGVS